MTNVIANTIHTHHKGSPIPLDNDQLEEVYDYVVELIGDRYIGDPYNNIHPMDAVLDIMNILYP